MVAKKDFDIKLYTRDLCGRAGINPEEVLKIEDDLLGNTEISYSALLEIILIQNYDLFRNALPILKANNYDSTVLGSIFGDKLREQNWELSWPPENQIIKYLETLSRLKTLEFPVSNIEFVFRFYNLLFHDTIYGIHLFLLGESGTYTLDTIQLIYKYYYLRNYDKSDYQSNGLKIYECTGQNDEILHSDIFGHAKSNGLGPYYDRIGLIETLTKKAESNIREISDHRGKNIVVPNYGLIVITEFQKAGSWFQKAVVDYCKDGDYCRLGETEKHRGNCKIACSITCSQDEYLASNLKSLLHETEYGPYLLKAAVPPLRSMPSEIPVRIYLIAQSVIKKREYRGRLLFPQILYRYWLVNKRWENNYAQLKRDMSDYVNEYIDIVRESNLEQIGDLEKKRTKTKKEKNHQISGNANLKATEEKRALFMKLINLEINYDFRYFNQENEFEPYELLSLEDIISKPFVYYIFRRFNKDIQNWEFDHDALRIAALNQIDGLLSRMNLLWYDQEPLPIIDLNSRSEPELIQSMADSDALRVQSLPASEVRDNKSEAKRAKYRLSDIRKIYATLDRENKADPIIIIEAKDGSIDRIAFKSESTAEFSMLLFLIYERHLNNSGWISDLHMRADKKGKIEQKTIDSAIILQRLQKIREYCDLYESSGQISNEGWWNNLTQRKSAIDGIRKKFKPKIDGNIIKKLPKYSSYRECTLIPELQAEIKNLP